MTLRSSAKELFARFGYRVTHETNTPVADLAGFCRNIKARGFAPKRIVDVGANRAAWSTTVRSVFPDADFTLLEPQIELKPYLDRFCADAKSARWINAGAGDADGELTFTPFPDTVSSSFATSADEASAMGLEQRVVPVTTLDTLCADVIGAIPDMVKLDVEGFEHKVLEGSKTLIGQTELFLLELTLFEPRADSKVFHEMVALMADLGYRVYDFTTFQFRPLDGAIGLCEAVFAREAGQLRADPSWV